MWLEQLNLRESSGAGTKSKDAEVGVRNADTAESVSDKTQHKAKDTGTDRLPVTAVLPPAQTSALWSPCITGWSPESPFCLPRNSGFYQ